MNNLKQPHILQLGLQQKHFHIAQLDFFFKKPKFIAQGWDVVILESFSFPGHVDFVHVLCLISILPPSQRECFDSKETSSYLYLLLSLLTIALLDNQLYPQGI